MSTFKVFSGIMVVLVLFTNSAFAQEGRSQVNLQATATVVKDSSNEGTSQDVTKSGGFLAGYSYQFHRWAGVEGNYGYTRNTQRFAGDFGNGGVRSDIHQVTGAFVLHVPLENTVVKPYALSGAGALIFDPKDEVSVIGAEQQTRATFLYGGGLNFAVASNVGVRAEYRGFVYKTPDFKSAILDIDKFTHLAQPSVGIFFRF